MRFIVISVATLSLGANVFAAPTSLITGISSLPAVAPAAVEVENVAGSVTSGLRRKDAVSSVTGTVESVPVVNKVTGEVVSVAGSATSGLGKKNVVSTVMGTVESVPVVNKVTGEVAGVAGTETSALSKKAGSVMTIVTGSVTTLKSSVQSDLTSLSTYFPNPSCLYLLTSNL